MKHDVFPLAIEEEAAVSSALYRDGMARLGGGVTIVTTDGPAGRVGFTATAVCSVTDKSPTLIVCINQSSSAFRAVTTNGVLAVNVLTAEQQPLADLFGGKTPMDQRFAAAAWTQGETAAPLLPDASASFECRITGHAEQGSHHVLFCSVVAVHMAEQFSGLVYFARRYHALAGT
ncbi:MAG: rutF [Proteobacteria bacterium]|nr:rutF [Pseudomonadota bacterium]